MLRFLPNHDYLYIELNLQRMLLVFRVAERL